MGLIASRLEEVRNDVGWLTRDDGEEPAGYRTSSGVRPTRSMAMSLTTVWRCVDLLASAVAMAPKDIILKVGPRSFPEHSAPTWLERPDPRNPNFTANDYFATVAVSLLLDGNFFTWVPGGVAYPLGLVPWDPTLVEVLDGPVYRLKDGTGKVVKEVGPEQMLHGMWRPLAGSLRGISPLETLRRTVGSAIAAEDFAGRFFGQGAALSFGVEVPGEMDNTKRDDLRASLKQKYSGASNQHAVGVLTGGAKFVGGLGPTPEQAQMLETRKFAVEDLCRPFGVPPSMAGSQEPGAASYASAAVWDMQFKQRGVQPLAVRIEEPHERLLQVPIGLDGPNVSMQFRFNLDAIARADLLTRAQAEGEWVQKGQMTPNEARALENREPLPGGDLLYMQQQMVPITVLGQTKATEPLDTQPAPAGAEAA